MAGRYPEIEPYASGMLAVGEGNLVYWETCGNPDGTPAVVLHGGPGSGCSTSMRRYFDPAAYRIVLFDQRNCGRGTPRASDPAVSLAANTTQHLLADIEQLREHLGIERWLVFGWSWGCALALAYAEQYTGRVSQVVVTGAATGRQSEVDLLTRGLGQLFPADWAKFRDGAGDQAADGGLPAAYNRPGHARLPAALQRDRAGTRRARPGADPRPGPRHRSDPIGRQPDSHADGQPRLRGAETGRGRPPAGRAPDRQDPRAPAEDRGRVGSDDVRRPPRWTQNCRSRSPSWSRRSRQRWPGARSANGSSPPPGRRRTPTSPRS